VKFTAGRISRFAPDGLLAVASISDQIGWRSSVSAFSTTTGWSGSA
jgi:hypothetical protein